MNPFRIIQRWLGFPGQDRALKQIDEELRFHLEQSTAENIAAGMSPEEAARAARKRFGNVQALREECREVRGAALGENVLQDIRFGARMLRKNPGFTAAAVVTLALGIGANTAIFSVVNGVLLQPLPFNDPDRLVVVRERNMELGFSQFSVAPGTLLDWQAGNHVFENLAACTSADFNFASPSGPERILGVRVSANYLPTFKIRPLLGRGFLPEEDAPGQNSVVILSRAFWQSRFGGEQNIVGKQINLNGVSRTVVGVADLPEQEISVLVPISFSSGERGDRGGHWLFVQGRLKPGISLEQARTEMDALAKNLQREYPDAKRGWTVLVDPLLDFVVGDIRPGLLLLLCAVGLVLLIGCANVASLLLARASVRRREFATRTALGAGRWRLVRQLLTESLLLGLCGGVGGLLVAAGGLHVVRQLAPANLPRLEDVRLDGIVLGFALIASLATGIIFGLVPALQASGLDSMASLKEGGRGTSGPRRNRLRTGLVVAEIALSLMLLVNASLVMKSFIRLHNDPPGYITSHLLTVDVGLPQTKYQDSTKQAAFFDELLDRVAHLPGIESVGAVSDLPLSNRDCWLDVKIDGRTIPPSSAAYRQVSANYFHTMKIPMVAGREFNDQDRESSPAVVVVNQTFARTFFPNEEALGKRIHIGNPGPNPCEIVGITRDVKNYGLEEKIPAEMYQPYRQRCWGYFSVVARTAADPTAVTGALRKVVLDLDKDQPIHNVRTVEELFVKSTAGRRFMMILMGTFAAVALVLCAIGIYGLISYIVAQRTQEFGIRMALGAGTNEVLCLVLRQGLRPALAGLALGSAGAWFTTRLLQNQLYGVEAHDPATFAIGFFALGSIALAACFIPACRATRINPMTALRCE